MSQTNCNAELTQSTTLLYSILILGSFGLPNAKAMLILEHWYRPSDPPVATVLQDVNASVYERKLCTLRVGVADGAYLGDGKLHCR